MPWVPLCTLNFVSSSFVLLIVKDIVHLNYFGSCPFFCIQALLESSYVLFFSIFVLIFKRGMLRVNYKIFFQYSAFLYAFYFLLQKHSCIVSDSVFHFIKVVYLHLCLIQYDSVNYPNKKNQKHIFKMKQACVLLWSEFNVLSILINKPLLSRCPWTRICW